MNTKYLLPLAFFALFISNVFAQEFQIDSIAYQAELCGGDCSTAMLFFSGGLPPYSFAWSDGTQFDELEYCSGGEYGVTVTDVAGIMAIGSFEVEMYPELSLESPTNNGDIVVVGADCDDEFEIETRVVAAGGVPPYEYSWNGDAFDTISVYINLPGGMYTVVVRDDVGCTAMIEFTQTEVVFSPLVVDVTISENTATATPSGGTPPYTYQWNDPNMQTTATAVGLEEGIYSVTVTGANGCEVTEMIDLTVGIYPPEYLTNFDIFPNPSNGKFTIDLQFEVAQTATIQVFNELGQQMYHLRDTQSHFQQNIDINGVSAGTYFVVIATESGHLTRRIVILE